MTVWQKREGNWDENEVKNQKERKHVQLSKDKDVGVSRINGKARFEKGEIPEKTKGK